ncbi:MAG: hypothetical protein C4531_07950 [Desulfurivibrio sp.]|nr:MAG: hypothetical protein C4531_07950 [Desulfurivibrio sp.]
MRHWKDAELLEKDNRLENADHLYGFAAECAIKNVLVRLPSFSRNGKLEKSYKEHVNVLWGRVNYQNLQKSYPHLSALLKSPNPFADWDVNQRYAANDGISKTALELHKISAKRLLGIINLPGSRKT